MGEQSRETLVSSIFSSNGAQLYFKNESKFHASFYCRNSGGTSFFKGPLSYADSWAYCENYDGTLGEFYHFFPNHILLKQYFLMSCPVIVCSVTPVFEEINRTVGLSKVWTDFKRIHFTHFKLRDP